MNLGKLSVEVKMKDELPIMQLNSMEHLFSIYFIERKMSVGFDVTLSHFDFF